MKKRATDFPEADALASAGDPGMRQAAARHARQALARAEESLSMKADLDAVAEIASFATDLDAPV